MTKQMKNSGVKWIGQIPYDWEICRIKNVASLFTGNSIKDDEKATYEDPVNARPYIATKDVDATLKTINYENGMYIKLNDGNFKVAPAQSTLMCIEGGSAGKKKAQIEIEVSFVNKLCCFAPKSCVPAYLYYFLCSPGFEEEFARNLSGLIGGVSVSVLQNFAMILPPEHEQQRISEYLDVKCTRINTVIEQTQVSIEEYKKLRQAVITQAVTKGVRGDRPMKDSGIEWIGEIPEEWQWIPFRHVLKERQEKNSPVKTEERLSLSIDSGVTLYAEKTTNLDRFKDDFEQYKLAHEGDLVMNSMNMIVGATGVSDYFGCVSPVYYTFYDELVDHATAKYCEYIFRSKTMLRVLFSLGKGIYAIVRGDDRVNTCRLKVSKEDLKSIVIPQPPVEEQREIISYLDSKCSEIDALIAKKEQFLAELENYKKSMIYEYVTGKKEVPQNA